MHHFKPSRKNFTKLTDPAHSDEIPFAIEPGDDSIETIELGSSSRDTSSSSRPPFSVIEISSPTAAKFSPTATKFSPTALKFAIADPPSTVEDDILHRRGSSSTTPEWNNLPEIQPPEAEGDAGDEPQTFNTDANQIRGQLKRDMFLLLEDPSSSRAAFMTNVLVSVSIVSSAVMTTIETIPSFRSRESNAVWFNLETAMVLLFTLEYLMRFFAHSDSFRMLFRFVTAPLAIIDFLSIMPYYVELIAQRDTTYEFRFTILRLFRLLRLFKSFKYSNTIVMTIEVMVVALRRSGDALSALFFFLVTSVVLFSTLLYFAERGGHLNAMWWMFGRQNYISMHWWKSCIKGGLSLSLSVSQCGVWDANLETFVTHDGVPSAFDSIPSAFWFVIVTITTTGYGDMVPTTFIGKLITFPAMMFGVLLIALPSIIVGRNFTLVWETMRQYRHSQDRNSMPIHHEDGLFDFTHDRTRHSFESRRSIVSEALGDSRIGRRPGGYAAVDPDSDEQELLADQLQALMIATQQNQVAINRILQLLETRGVGAEVGNGIAPGVAASKGSRRVSRAISFEDRVDGKGDEEVEDLDNA
ncbi:LOW QUALITY PROTEIN: hypothetical protein BC936DRAFT_145436 [Jimgerdemannia flammicorona]|uniref:Ion transport domain-containing protein n=1 Tax=Jimgerdemannia flammicorona TaxID=994334 RepID=A0A433DA26_9FUNG|nr:LOW QUALITY PROTEIN: hypothetical protein BC936DRAFT_145436 [Jimgerdemannia flammicorona]